MTQHPVAVFFREAVRRLELLLAHFLGQGVLAGVNQQLDPDVRRSTPDTVLTLVWLFAGTALALLSGAPELRVAAVWLICSPIWLYAASTLEDEVMENRAYLLPLSVAAFAAWAAQRSPFAVLLLIVLYGSQTAVRNTAWDSVIGFWRRASQESPWKPRPRVNYAERLGASPDFDRQCEALNIYQSLFHVSHRSAGTAYANVGQLYMQWAAQIQAVDREQSDRLFSQAGAVMDEGLTKWPNHSILLVNRAALFMLHKDWRGAIAKLDHALSIRPHFAPALRNRTICYTQVNRTDLAEKDRRAVAILEGRI